MSKSKFDAILGRIREEDMITDQIIGGGSQSSGGGSTVVVGSPLTTKGDLYGYDVADARIPVGTDGQFLVADSADAQGVKWGNQAYTEFIFNSTGTQSGNRYNTWSDLEATLQATEGYKRVTFENTSVVSPPFFNEAITLSGDYDDVTFRGNGTAAVSGGLLIAISGGVTSWSNMVIEGGLGFIYVGAVAPFISVTTFTAKLAGGSAFLTAGGQPIFSHSTGTLTIDLQGGSILAGASLGGGTIIAKGSGAGTVLLLAGSSNSNIENDIVTGTAGTVQVISTDAGSADISGVTQSGFSGTYTIDYLSKSLNIKGAFYQKIQGRSASTSTHTWNVDTDDGFYVSPQSKNFTINAPTGTLREGLLGHLWIKDDGNSWTITWNAVFADFIATRPTATTPNKWHYMVFRYSTNDSKWYCIHSSIDGVSYHAKDINVPDEAYGAGWDGSTEVPTKNAIYDKIQTILDTTDTYTLSNVTTDRALDADSVTLAELADIVGTLVQDLKDRGIIG